MQKKLLMFLLTLVMCLGAITSEASNVAIVLDVPSVIYKDPACLASVNKTSFKEKFPEGSVFKTAQEGITAAKEYRIKHYNAEMDASRHNGYMGYKNAFTIGDLMGIAKEQNCDYVMFIKTYGAWGEYDFNQKAISVIPIGGFVKKINHKATLLKLYFNCQVVNAKNGTVEVEQKFDVETKAQRQLDHKLYYNNLYKDSFKNGMSSLGNPNAAKKTGGKIGLKGLFNKIR